MKKILSLLIILLLATSLCFADNNGLSGINSFDRQFARQYNETLDKAGTALQFLTMATPAVLLAQEKSEYFTIGTMYLETVALTYGAKTIAKKLIPRNRPYTYFPTTAPESEKDDWNKSFPSGHSAFAFAGATFTSYVFSKYNPDSKWKIPVIAGSYALATATAALRVSSGNHFVTDVLAGAALGSAIGFLVPYIHTKINNQNVSVGASPFGLVFSMTF